MEKILSLVWFPIFPAHFGGQKGIADFYRFLSAHFPIDCLCASANERINSGNLQTLPELPNYKGQFFQPFIWKKILRCFRQKQYKFVLIEFPYYGFVGYLLKKQGALYILHTHNIESDRFRQMGKWWWPLLSYYEKWSMQQADLVLFKTEQDKAFAIRHFAIAKEKSFVLPYGINRKSIPDKKTSRQFLEQTYHIAPDETILLFAGTLDYLPNAEAVTAIYQHVLPLLCREMQRFRIIICGRNKEARFDYLKKYRHEQVIQAGFVEDMAFYFSGADVFINPVQKVFGVQTKIIDAIASALNVVAFEEAGAGLPSYLLNEKLFLAGMNRYDDFVQKIREAVSVRKPTPEHFYEEFHWKKIVSNFAERLKSVRV